MKLLFGSSFVFPFFGGAMSRIPRKSAAAVPLSLASVFALYAGGYHAGAGIPSAVAAILSGKRSWQPLLFLVVSSSALFLANGNITDPILWLVMLGASRSWRQKPWPMCEAVTFSLTAHIIGSLLFLLRGGSVMYLQRIIALTIVERILAILSFLGGYVAIRSANFLFSRFTSRNSSTGRSLLCSR